MIVLNNTGIISIAQLTKIEVCALIIVFSKFDVGWQGDVTGVQEIN